MEPQAAANLPRAHVLSYVANADSPTRVRQVAARALVVIAVLSTLAALIALAMLVWNTIAGLMERLESPPPWREPLVDRLWWIGESNLHWIILLVASLTFATVFFALARPVRRGRPVACNLAAVTILPIQFAFLLAAAGFGGSALMIGFGTQPERLMLLLLIPAALATLLVLLLYDLFNFLRWIARNPITDAPKIPFLSPRTGG